MSSQMQPRSRRSVAVDDTFRDALYALRTFRRAPLVAATIVSTVALGLGLVTVAFTMLNALVFRVDAVPQVHEMFAVERQPTAQGERLPFTRAQFDALRRETSVFTGAYAQVADVDTRIDGRTAFGSYVTGNMFQVLAVGAAIGRALRPADDEPGAEQPVLVLSQRGWDRLFARDPTVLGRRLLVNRIEFEIVGVMPEAFRGLAAAAPDDYWAPLATLDRVRGGRTHPDAVTIIGRLKPGVSRESAVAQLAAWHGRLPDAGRVGSGAPPIALVPRQGTVEQPLEALAVTAPLFFGFGLILVIACANVANLLLARAIVRQREIGIRLSLGAGRLRIVRQLLTENLLLSFLAAAAGFAISRLVLRAIIDALVATMPPNIGDIRLLVPDADWRVLLFLFAGAVASTLFFALAPALQATRIEPLRTVRGEVAGEARPGRARDLLIGVQVGASALLLISSAVFLRSSFAVAAADPGIRISDTVVVPVMNEPVREAMVGAVLAEPSVAAVAATWPGGLGSGDAAFASTDVATRPVAYRFVSPDYFSVLDIAVVRGRPFTAAERAPDLPVAIVSESTARALWPDGAAVGQLVRLEPNAASGNQRGEGPPLRPRTFTVVGVARDVAGFRIAPSPRAVVYLPADTATPGTVLIARVRGDVEKARQALEERLLAVDPDMEQVGAFGWVTVMETYFLQVAFWSTVALGALALALTLSGLFSVLSYVVERRAQEIGVRMALGATARDVTRLVLWQSARPVTFGLAMGAGSAFALSAALLATPAAAPMVRVVQVIDPIAYFASLAIIVLACLLAASIPAGRAAALDPMLTLRRE